MTGMGKVARSGHGISVVVEIRSVNNRYLVIKNHFPDMLNPFESRLHEMIRSRVGRGTVDLFIKVHLEDSVATCSINKGILDGYIHAAKGIKKKERLEGDLSPELLLGLPGVVEIKNEYTLSKAAFAVVEEAMRLGVDRLYRMRVSEGKRLTRGLRQRCRLVEQYLREVVKKSARSVEERQARLKARLKELLAGEKGITPEDPTLQR
jgi:uncharacterized protein (TIGR00255 family)